jgi:hypothetical protein
MPISHLLAGALLVLPLVALAPAPAAAEEDQTRRLTMTGTGQVSARPDIAHLTLGVGSAARTARAALDANNAAMGRVVAALTGAGIADKDLQTSGFQVLPRYFQDAKADEPPRVVGYEVSNSLHIAVRDLDRLGPVLDLAVTEGSNRIDGLAFGFAEPEALMDRARAGAVADARRKAAIYAEGLGVTLGKVLSVDEYGGGGGPVPMMARAAAMAAAVPIAAGETTLSVQVNVVWEIE